MSKKNNKIFVCVSPEADIREKMVCELAMRIGLVTIRSDAKKILRHSVYDIELSEAYFVLVDNFAFRDSPSTTQRLYEMAARGIAVIVGVKKMPREYEIISDIYYPEHLF